ncbi:MAG: LysM peptidoglycan-binding domain-containing protein, partial [Chloroflexota bacterium]
SQGSRRSESRMATALASANGITNTHLIFVGQRLTIPTGSSSVSSSASSATSGGACGSSYVVKQGETLKIIAAKCGTTVTALVAANNIANRDLIFVNQRLTLPGGTAAPVFDSAPTATPAPAATSAPAPVTTSRGITGALTLCNPEKPSFAATIERICFRELITNTTGAPVGYSILGVQVTSLTGGQNQFQTSWHSDLVVPAGGTGPVPGGWEDGIYINIPGTYQLTLSICYLNAGACFLGTGWEVLTAGVNVNVVIWNP